MSTTELYIGTQPEPEDRLKITISEEDAARIPERNDRTTTALITDQATGKVYNVRRASCGLSHCWCALELVPDGATAVEHYENLATILAALRLFQRTYQDKDAAQIRADWPEHFADIAPLSTPDIDALCVALNIEDLVRVFGKSAKPKR